MHVEPAKRSLHKAKESLKAASGENAMGALCRLLGHALPENEDASEIKKRLVVLEAALSLSHARGVDKIKSNFNVNGLQPSRIIGAFTDAHNHWNENAKELMKLRDRMLSVLEKHVTLETMQKLQQPKTGK